VKVARVVGYIVFILGAIGLGIRAAYLNIEGRPQVATSVALGLTVALLHVVAFVPALRPTPEAARRPTSWNLPGRVLIVLTWLARSALSGYASYFVAQELDRGFNLTLLEFAVAAQMLTLLWRIGYHLAGFRLDWSGYRGRAELRRLANAAVRVILAGYAFVVADLLDGVLFAIPRAVYRGLDGMWHLPWLNVPIVVVVSAVALIILAVVVNLVQGVLARVLGQGNALGQKLEDLRVVRWEGDVRDLWRDRGW
jgi:hypothetical protein